MTVRALTVGIILVLMISICVSLVEMFVLLSVKSDMNLLCRKTLFEMETSGGLDNDMKVALRDSLSNSGFRHISITGNGVAKQGEELYLKVEADYKCSRLKSLLIREEIFEHMAYNRVTISRKVVN